MCIRSPYRVALLLALPLAISALAWATGRDFLQRNPNYYVADVARSVWNSGSLVSETAREMYERLERLSSENPESLYTQDVFSIGEEGDPLPLRATYLSVLAAPFVGLGGEAGLWLLSQVMIFGVLLAWTELNCRWIGARMAIPLALIFMVGSALVRYSYSFSYDTFALALLLTGLATQRRFQVLGAFLIALSVETRPLFALFLPLAFFEAVDAPSRNRFIRGAVGIGLALGLVALTNTVLWGSPETFSYHRWAGFQAGEVILVPPDAHFSFGELASDLPQKIFGTEAGLITTNPVLLLALPAGIVAARFSRGMGLLLAVSVLYLGFVLALQNWADYGNLVRYSLPAVGMLSLSLAFLGGRYRDSQKPS